MKHIFIDTNIFLHCQIFDQIDWLSICSSESCKLVISPIVINELDKYKVGNSKISKRARSVLLKIEKYAENELNEIKENILLEVITKKPSNLTYETNDLNFDEQDHRLIASIIEYQKLNPNVEIYLCSNDIGPRLSAKQYQIEAIKLPEKYLLPDEDSEKDKKIKKLEEENILLRTKIPKLALEFENRNDFIKILIDTKEPEKNEYIEEELSKIKKDYPYLEIQPKDPKSNPFISFTSLSDYQIVNYNKDLDKYFKEYKDFLYYQQGYEETSKLAIRIKIFLVNTGTIPAEDVDIHLHFPDGFELMNLKDFQKPPEKPEPPYKPKSGLDFGNIGISSYITNMHPKLPDLDFNKPTIKKTNSYDVNFNIKYLKHNYNKQLDELVAVYNHFIDMINFSIDYEISAANLPISYTSKLKIIYEK